MNRILVLFDSKSGNVAKMAALVAEGAQRIADTEVRVRSVDDATADDVIWCDGLAVGSPTNMGILSWKMKRFWDEAMMPHWMDVDGKIACAFSSAGAWGGGMELACQSILTVLMNFGFLVFGVTDYATKLRTAHYGAVVAKEPRSDDDTAGCRLLGQRLAEWVAVCIPRTKRISGSAQGRWRAVRGARYFLIFVARSAATFFRVSFCASVVVLLQMKSASFFAAGSPSAAARESHA